MCTTTPFPMKATHSGLTKPTAFDEGSISRVLVAGSLDKLTRGKQVEVELGLLAINVGYNGVARVVTTGASRADVGLSGEDVDKFTLACREQEARVGGIGSGPTIMENWGSPPRVSGPRRRRSRRLARSSRTLSPSGHGDAEATRGLRLAFL